jgi:SAM-dependent methyltransferase
LSWRLWQPNLTECPENWGKIIVNLQYGDCTRELNEVKEKLGITIHVWEDANPLKDLDNFAAQIYALDLVISVDNSTVHMAGALGKPVWTLLPFAPDWRWMLNCEDSPWYPTMRLFRQPSPGDWNSVIDKVCEDLKSIIENNVSSIDNLTFPLRSTYKKLCNLNNPNEALLLDKSKALSDICNSLTLQTIDIDEKERMKYSKAWAMEDRLYAKYSPGLEISNTINFLDFFKANNVKSILDAGIGSGKLCKKMIDMGFQCHGVDIVDDCLDEELQEIKNEILTVGALWDTSLFKENMFDAVVCLDVLEHVPTDYVVKVVDNLYYWARKYIFLQIALFQDYFGKKVGEPLHLTVQPKSWWDIIFNKYEIIQDFVLKNNNGKDVYAIYLISKTIEIQ